VNSEEVIDVIQDYIDDEEILSEKKVIATTDRERYRDALQTLWDKGIQHITTITATDFGEETEIIYHISCDGTLLDLVVSVPNEDLEISTITDIYPAAILYERELMDLFGIDVLDHPDPRTLVLPDDWPEYKYPLKKGQYDYQAIAEAENVSDVKEIAEDDDFDPELMLEAEKENKDRKSLIEWLETRIGKEEGD